MRNARRFYKGYEIDAIALRSGSEFVAQVKLTKVDHERARKTILSPPSGKVYAHEDQALTAAMKYGVEAVDGRLIAFDPSA